MYVLVRVLQRNRAHKMDIYQWIYILSLYLYSIYLYHLYLYSISILIEREREGYPIELAHAIMKADKPYYVQGELARWRPKRNNCVVSV